MLPVIAIPLPRLGDLDPLGGLTSTDEPLSLPRTNANWSLLRTKRKYNFHVLHWGYETVVRKNLRGRKMNHLYWGLTKVNWFWWYSWLFQYDHVPFPLKSTIFQKTFWLEPSIILAVKREKTYIDLEFHQLWFKKKDNFVTLFCVIFRFTRYVNSKDGNISILTKIFKEIFAKTICTRDTFPIIAN